MAQLTIYLTKETERKARIGAKSAKTSVSAYIAKLIEGKRGRKDRHQRWPPEFLAVLGSWKDAESPDEGLLPLDEPTSWG